MVAAQRHPEEGWVRTSEASRLLGVSEQRVVQLANNGKLVADRDEYGRRFSLRSIRERLGAAQPCEPSQGGRRGAGQLPG